MWIFVDKNNATVVANSGRSEYQGQLGHPPLEVAQANAAKETGLAAADLLPYPITEAAQADRLLAAWGGLLATVQDGQVTAVIVDPAWQPPAPAPDPLAALMAKVDANTEAVARNVASSPHDKRGMTDKDIGKLIIPKIKSNPAMTVDEALDEIVEMILAEIPGEPIIPTLWVERPRKSNPAETVYMGLGPSYLFEAIKRGYCPATTPMTWDSLVGLIVATPEEQIAAWLRSL